MHPLNTPQSAFRENVDEDSIEKPGNKYNNQQPPRKHHRNIALETGRKGEQKESEDHDKPIKTVYPDSSRFNRVTAAGHDEALDTDKTRKIREALGGFSVEILDEALESLEIRMQKDIEKVKRKYEKIMDPIKKAKEMNKFM